MAKKTSTKTISAEEFDRKFDAGEDMSEFLDWNSLRPFYGPNKKPLERGEKRKASVKAPKFPRARAIAKAP